MRCPKCSSSMPWWSLFRLSIGGHHRCPHCTAKLCIDIKDLYRKFFKWWPFLILWAVLLSGARCVRGGYGVALFYLLLLASVAGFGYLLWRSAVLVKKSSSSRRIRRFVRLGAFIGMLLAILLGIGPAVPARFSRFGYLFGCVFFLGLVVFVVLYKPSKPVQSSGKAHKN